MRRDASLRFAACLSSTHLRPYEFVMISDTGWSGLKRWIVEETGGDVCVCVCVEVTYAEALP